MTEKLKNEWFLKTKWGNVAMISWGDRRKPRVLLLHGYMDSAATYDPLMSLLPDTHYYVTFDWPGHGKSDHVLTGLIVNQGFIVEIIKEVVHHLQWRTFVTIAHSVGFMMVSMYHYLYPGRITKMINLDPIVPFTTYFYYNELQYYWFKWYYEFFYDHYNLYDGTAPPRLLKREQILETTMSARNLTREQAEVVLSRSLVPAGNGLYKTSTQPIMRRLINLTCGKELLLELIHRNTPLTLNIHGTRSEMTKEERKFAEYFLRADNPNIFHVNVDAQHDLHVTHPEEIVPYIVKFLKEKSYTAKL